MEKLALAELIESGVKSEDFYEKTDENLERAVELESLGFSRLAQEIVEKVQLKDKLHRISEAGYIKIPLQNIKDFLKKKVERYNREHETKPSETTSDWEVPNNNLMGLYNLRRLSMEYDRQMSGYHNIVTPNYSSPITWDGTGLHLVSSDKASTEKFHGKTCDYLKSEGIGKFEWEEIPLDQYETLPPKDILDKLKEDQKNHLFDYYTIGHVKELPDPVLLGRINGQNDRWFICQWGDDVSLDDII